MKKISKKVREEAALICHVGASNTSLSYTEIRQALGYFLKSRTVALEAYSFVAGRLPNQRQRTIDAEAESLLRTGKFPVED